MQHSIRIYRTYRYGPIVQQVLLLLFMVVVCRMQLFYDYLTGSPVSIFNDIDTLLQ